MLGDLAPGARGPFALARLQRRASIVAFVAHMLVLLSLLLPSVMCAQCWLATSAGGLALVGLLVLRSRTR
jgi:hypothetical protein